MRERCEGGSSIDQTPSCGHCDSSSASLTQLAQRFPRSKLGIIVLCVLLSATSISASPLLQLQPVLRTLARGNNPTNFSTIVCAFSGTEIGSAASRRMLPRGVRHVRVSSHAALASCYARVTR